MFQQESYLDVHLDAVEVTPCLSVGSNCDGLFGMHRRKCRQEASEGWLLLTGTDCEAAPGVLQ